jgi:hypothetical protein
MKEQRNYRREEYSHILVLAKPSVPLNSLISLQKK